MDEFTVVVGTCGDRYWPHLARRRAIPSAKVQARVVHVHATDVATARNEGLNQVTTEFVVFLDADDELEPGFIEAMAGGFADLRVPAIRQVIHGVQHDPFIPQVSGHDHECEADCLRDGNWMVIGTAARAELVRNVGGFKSEWPVYEDYDLWQRMWLAGATIERMPTAIYRAHVQRVSRNRSMSVRRRNQIHEQIDLANGMHRASGKY
jgi:glycosyltransferase involved in cell wall biosynthesis